MKQIIIQKDWFNQYKEKAEKILELGDKAGPNDVLPFPVVVVEDLA